MHVVKIPPVRTFPGVAPDKAQALKPLEEASEIHAAWQDYVRTKSWSDDWDECLANNDASERALAERFIEEWEVDGCRRA